MLGISFLHHILNVEISRYTYVVDLNMRLARLKGGFVGRPVDEDGDSHGRGMTSMDEGSTYRDEWRIREETYT